MNGKEIKEWASGLPDDAIILASVVGSDDSHAWTMEFKLSDELTNFMWDSPVYAITLSHPDLKNVNDGFLST